MTILRFWFDFSCPYAYLASTQAEALAARASARLEWAPFLLGGVFAARGTAQNLAETMGEAKARHNALDMQRQAARAGVPLSMPAGHPIRTVDALRAVLATGIPPRLVHAFYRAYWVDGVDIAREDGLRAVLGGAGFEPDEVLARARSDEVRAELRARTDAAVAAGLFGAPSWEVPGSDLGLVWGADRMDVVGEALGLPRAPSVARHAGPPVDLWFDYASPFGSFAALRAPAWFGPRLRLRPMLLGALFRAVGTPDVPLFAMPDSKRAWMARDMARQARDAGLILQFPSRFPIRTVLPLRVTLLAQRRGDATALVASLVRGYWVEDRDPTDPADVAALCSRAGWDGGALVADAAAAKEGLFANTEEAAGIGVFGAPTFAVDPGPSARLYWGNDRLDLALADAAGHTARSDRGDAP